MMLARAAILSTGDELTTGRIVDTNANWLADKFFELGVDVTAVLTVGDYPERLEWAWRQAIAQADLVVSTGGIGPTADDLTSETVARVAGVPLVLHEESADRIRGFFARANRPMPEHNLRQAMIPRGAEIVPNPLGLAASREIARHLAASGGLFLLATHDQELAALATDPSVQGVFALHFRDEIVDGRMDFPYRVQPGAATTHNAIRLLELSGYPREIVERARQQAEGP